ncbi:MAG: flagellar export chaperone FliS [Gallionella sp.]|nr:flagellar export chaperone FliS [Gallionella sp.]
MNAITAISAYKKVGIESSATSADPHKLITMLFQGALLAIANAKNQMLKNETMAKGKSISHAISIIGEGLHASLDTRVKGQLVQDLSALYDYMVRRLTEANIENNVAILDEVTGILTELKSAWDSIRPNNSQPVNQPQPVAKAQLVYGRG